MHRSLVAALPLCRSLVCPARASELGAQRERGARTLLLSRLICSSFCRSMKEVLYAAPCARPERGGRTLGASAGSACTCSARVLSAMEALAHNV